MSSVQQNFLYRQFFRLRVHESFGDAFQLLFSRIMSYTHPGFQSVVPCGNWGDGGNDGWIEAEAHYFQVYGPKPNTKISETDAINKAIKDYEKIPKKWGVVKSYSFVMNDRFIGIPAPVGAALLKLKANKGLNYTGTIGGTDLLIKFMALPGDIRQDIIGGVPSENPEFVDPRAVSELLSHLSDKVSPCLSFLCENAPDFDKKIIFNGIGRIVKARLEANFYQTYTISHFLDAREDGLTQAIAKEIKETYTESKSAIPDSIEDAADLRYFWMVDKIIPPSVHEKHPHSVAAYRVAAEIVLAKYFETCDAYEHPDNAFAA